MVFVPSVSDRSQPVPLVRDGLPRLDTQRCRALLAGASSGHLALSQGALPMVLPVTCRVDGDSLLVRASLPVLGRAPSQPGIVAFAASGANADETWRWEVVVQGRAEVVGQELAVPGAVPAPGVVANTVMPPNLPLLRGDLTTVLRISMELVAGWQYGTLSPLTEQLEEQLDDPATN